jgi:Galactose oxidase, central domain/Kelch motif
MATGFGFTSIAAMRSARAFAAAVAWPDGSKVLVTGGASSNGTYSAELYHDNTRSWTHSEMTTARSRHTATLLKSGQVLVVGGDNSTDPSTAEVYNPNTNSWQKVFNNLHSPRVNHTATLLPDGRVLITGGLGPEGGPNLSTAEIFDPGNDPVNGSWTLINPMNDARALHTATLLPNGIVLVAGGASDNGTFNPTFLSSAELLHPTTGVWSRTSSMNDTHVGHTATPLGSDLVANNFTVLVAGGINSFGDISTGAELYNPPPPVVFPPADISDSSSSDGSSWVRVGSMNWPRMFHTATALPAAGPPLHRTQQVLVTGGPDPGNEITSGQTTEIYNSATGSWTLTGNMHSDRTGHIAGLLTGGKVLLAGGLGGAFGGTTVPSESAELGTGCNANAHIVVSPQQTMDFGQVHAGSVFNNSNFLPTVQNTGNALLTLTATISGPDAALFAGGVSTIPFALDGIGRCKSGPTAVGDGAPRPVFVQFAGWSPVPKTCHATLTLGGSNATNVPAGQTWVFPMTAQIVLSPNDVTIQINPPSFPGEVPIGETETGHLVIILASQINEDVSAIVRFPSPPLHGAFSWEAGDYIVGSAVPNISIPIDFTPRGKGHVTQTLELISNAQGSPHLVFWQATGKGGITP